MMTSRGNGGTSRREPSVPRAVVSIGTRRGHQGATIQHPGWGGADISFLPFPASRAAYNAHAVNKVHDQ